MCDCRIRASKWDLSVHHEGAAALQLSENSCSEGHNQSLDTVQYFWEFLQPMGLFLLPLFCFVLPSSSSLCSCLLPLFSLSSSLVFISLLFPFWQSSAVDHLFIRSEAFCSEMTYLLKSQRIDFITVLMVVLAGGGENGSIID